LVRTIIADRHALRDASLAGLVDRVARGASGLRVQGASGSARALLAAVLFRRLGKPLVVVTPTEGEARGLHRDMAFFLGEDAALLYPEGETVATDILTAQTESERDRIHVLDRLLDGAPVSVVASLPALLRKGSPAGRPPRRPDHRFDGGYGGPGRPGAAASRRGLRAGNAGGGGRGVQPARTYPGRLSPRRPPPGSSGVRGGRDRVPPHLRRRLAALDRGSPVPHARPGARGDPDGGTDRAGDPQCPTPRPRRWNCPAR